ncbi:MAG: superoxide dismutase family protein [Cytophagales bacterium]|nr:superoxide dismutase family protein [Cytophagales bacterium]
MNKLFLLPIFISTILISSCDNSDDDPNVPGNETGRSKEYNLYSSPTANAIGTITFKELDDNTTKVEIMVTGVSPSDTHPTHIHKNSAAEGGDIAISLNPVDETSRKSETIVAQLDDGTAINYEGLIAFDGHVNVHKSADDLATIVAQGDIGPNELIIENSEDYELSERAIDGIAGEIIFIERASGEILAIISLENTPEGGEHPAHIHMNSAAVGGGIAVTFNPVDGTSGLSLTDFAALDDETSITFEQLKNFDGHVNVHLSDTELATIVAQGDIGGNEFTGEMEEYMLNEKAVEGISGKATFKERKSGKTLVEVALENTPEGGVHPSHIHMWSAAEGGDVVFPLNDVDGDTGMSYTDITMDKDENPYAYNELIQYDGHINVHLSAEALSTIVAQGDIGGNRLTGEFTEYSLNEKAVEGISGKVTYFERENGNALVTISLENTPEGGVHPTHIHRNSAVEGGDIFVTLNPVDGNTGFSMSTPRKSDDGLFETLPYDFLIIDDAHINVHLSAEDLGTIVAQGDVGGNKLTGDSKQYQLNENSGSGVSGTITFEKRENGFTLATIMLMGTPMNGNHPAHIHSGAAGSGGGVIIPLTNVDGDTGKSLTHIEKNSSDEEVKYDDLLNLDAHVNVHLSPEDLATIVAAGNIGSNAN